MSSLDRFEYGEVVTEIQMSDCQIANRGILAFACLLSFVSINGCGSNYDAMTASVESDFADAAPSEAAPQSEIPAAENGLNTLAATAPANAEPQDRLHLLHRFGR